MNYKYYKLKDQNNNDLAVIKTRNLTQRIYSYFFERKDYTVFYKQFRTLKEFTSYYSYIDFNSKKDEKEYPAEFKAYNRLKKYIPVAIYQPYRKKELTVVDYYSDEFISEHQYYLDMLQLLKYKKVEEIDENQWFNCKLNPLEDIKFA